MDEIRTGEGHERDPHRRWMRHTYQEGPGFRFLATRGGRPPESRPMGSQLAEVRRRAHLLRLAREDGLGAALAYGGCSRVTLWRWRCAYDSGGLAALVPERRGPHAPRYRYPAWVEQVVIAVRLHTYWNAKRIAAELRRREIAQVGHSWIEQLFDDLGTSRPSGPRPAGPRYERTLPNSLWHIDIKGPFFIQLERRRYLKTWIFGLVDDHSRYVLGLRIGMGREIATILAWLRDCIELCGRPLQLMSDNGTEFVHWMPGMLNRFGKSLRELEIRHIRTQVNTPWTNGKIESFWATLKSEVLDREVFRSLEAAEAALERFARYYNYHRLHGEIGWLTPGERFDGTPFTDRGFENIPALAHLGDWLKAVRQAA
ncbi:MAG: integrase core domain-containing protein [Dehalococcoidia bacterium]